MITKQSFDEVETALRGLFGANNPDSKLSGVFSAKVIQFSDSIVRVRPIVDQGCLAHPEEFLEEFYMLANLQLTMLLQGLLIRGGVTIGDVHCTGSQVFGPGLLRAYKLESKLAKYPRIVIDPIFFDTLDSHDAEVDPNSEFDEKTTLREWSAIDDDGVIWLDCIRAQYNFLEEMEEFSELFRNIKTFILSNLDSLAPDSVITSKYYWMVSYHNSCVSRYKKEISNEGNDFRNFLINAKECPVIHKLNTKSDRAR